MASVSNVVNIPSPTPIRVSGNAAVDWKRFKGQWSNYVTAAKLTGEDKARQAK